MLRIKAHKIICGPFIRFIDYPKPFFFFLFSGLQLGEKLYLLPEITGEWGIGKRMGRENSKIYFCYSGFPLCCPMENGKKALSVLSTGISGGN